MNEIFFNYGEIAYFVAGGIAFNFIGMILVSIATMFKFGITEMYKDIPSSGSNKVVEDSRALRYFVPFYLVFGIIDMLHLIYTSKTAKEFIDKTKDRK